MGVQNHFSDIFNKAQMIRDIVQKIKVSFESIDIKLKQIKEVLKLQEQYV